VKATTHGCLNTYWRDRVEKKNNLFGEIGWKKIICKCKENLYEKKIYIYIYMHREKK